MATVYLGNTAPIGLSEGASQQQVTTIQANEADRLLNLTVIKGLWTTQSTEPPAWVESEDERLAADVADVFSNDDHTCVVGRPTKWGEQ